MGTTFGTFAASLLGFILLDGLWLGVVMKEFYKRQLAPIGRMAADGSFAPLWAPAIVVYILLAAGVAVLVVPRAGSAAAAAAFGAVFGLVVYGVYDLTNYSTLAQWPLVVTAADIVWGTCACAAVSAGVFAVTAR